MTMVDLHTELTRMLPCSGPWCQGREHPAAFFKMHGVSPHMKGNARTARFFAARAGRYSICRACEQHKRDLAKRTNRGLVKVRRTRKDHAKRLGIPEQELIDRYGWTNEAMLASFDAVVTCGLPGMGCGRAFLDRGHDVTLDIIDPARAPYWGRNTQWLCHTCNSRKGRTPGDEWPIILVRWQQIEDERDRGEWFGQGRLFDLEAA